MTGLPQGWKKLSLGEVAKWGSGGTPTAGNTNYYDGEIPWAIIGDLNDTVVSRTVKHITKLGLENSSAKMVPAGAILIAMYGSIGKLGIAGIPMATNQAIAFAVPDESIVLKTYLFYYLRSQREILLWNGKGATQQNISQTLLKSWVIPIPPLPEQRKIVELLEDQLSRLDAALADVKQAERSLEVLEKSLLNKYFSIDGTKGSVLGEVAKIVDCEHKTAPRAEADGYAHSLGTSSIRNGVIDFKKAKPISEATYELWTSRQRPESGDLILTREAPVGEVAAIPEGVLCALGQRTVLIHIDRKLVSPKYLYHLLRTPILRKWMESNSLGTTVLHLNVADVKRIPLGELPGLNEQELIVENYSSTQEFLIVRKDLLNPVVALGESLRRSLLEAAFTGQLTKEVANV
jgi:type I restriction enzyme S subunit